jgi:hypothetical protein
VTTPFDLQALAKVPLAEAAFRLLDYALDDRALAETFQRHRGTALERKVRFPEFVRLIADALLGHAASSAHQAFRRGIEDGTLECSVQALYGKLRRMPLALSLGLFHDAGERLDALGTFGGPESRCVLPASLTAFRVLAFDGKKLKHVARLLKPLRGLKGKICGGKLLVTQDVATQRAVAVEAHPDGEAGEAPMVPGVVARVRAGSDSRPRLWIADRAFCDSKTLPTLAEGGDAFAIRHIASYHFHADPSQTPHAGKDSEGRSYVEEWGHLGSGTRRVPVRKITVTRPGEQPFALVTSLTDATVYPADDLLALYRLRWDIETMFQKVVQTFELRHLIGGSPEATVFQAVLCLLLYNITLVVRDAVAENAGRGRDTVSLALLFDDLRRQMTGLLQMVEPAGMADALAAVPIPGPEALQKHLRTILDGVWTNRWTKAPTRRGQPAKRTNRAYLGGGHSSVHKIRRGGHVEIPLETGPKATRTNKDRRPYETKNDDV